MSSYQPPFAVYEIVYTHSVEGTSGRTSHDVRILERSLTGALTRFSGLIPAEYQKDLRVVEAKIVLDNVRVPADFSHSL